MKITSSEITRKLIGLGWVVEAEVEMLKVVGIIERGSPESYRSNHDYFFGPPPKRVPLKATKLKRPKGVSRRVERLVMQDLLTWARLEKAGYTELSEALLVRMQKHLD